MSSNNVRYTTCALFTGLCVGASFWGVGSDLMGRRLAFNTTLFLAGVFALAVGGGPSWVGTCGLYAALGFGVGGNLPVDGVCLTPVSALAGTDPLVGTVFGVFTKRVPVLTDSIERLVAVRSVIRLSHCLGVPDELYM